MNTVNILNEIILGWEKDEKDMGYINHQIGVYIRLFLKDLYILRKSLGPGEKIATAEMIAVDSKTSVVTEIGLF